jgi:hypothetical protein
MLLDQVTWNPTSPGCNRCERPSPRYIIPYWKPGQRVCPQCCVELQRFYDDVGWPPAS